MNTARLRTQDFGLRTAAVGGGGAQPQRPRSAQTQAFRRWPGLAAVAALWILLTLPAWAQTRPPPADLRVVTNQLFNVSRSILWKPFHGECQLFLTNGIVLQEFKTTPIYGTPPPLNSQQSAGAYSAGPAGPPVIGETRAPGKRFLLRNCPAALQPTSGKEIKGTAMQTGAVRIGAAMLEVWDCGIPYRPPPPASTTASR